jgi:hypothetical protein
MENTMKNFLKLFVLVVVLSFIFSAVALAESYTSVTSGNWNNSATWTPTGIPGPTDQVTILATHTITLDAHSDCGSLTFTVRSSGISLVIGDFILDVYGTLHYDGLGSVSSTIITTGTGRMRFLGESGAIFGADWQAQPENWRWEVALDVGAVGYCPTSVKGGDVIISSGFFEAREDLYIDSGAVGTGTLVVNSGAGLRMAAGSIIRTATAGTGNFRALTIDGTLEFYASPVGSINADVISFNGDVRYISATDQTLVQKTSGGGGSATPNTYTNLTINGSGIKTVPVNTSVNGTFTLTSGLLDIGSSNLTLGASATISGTPSASNMIVATGTGELRKVFTGAPSNFLFPVGDNTGTAEYSPAYLQFNSGTFASAYAGVKLVNGKHPLNTSATDYLNRYWTITSGGISGFSCYTRLQYLQADVAGTESNILPGQWNGVTWNIIGTIDVANDSLVGNVTSFSDFTGGEGSAMPIQLVSFEVNIIGNNTAKLEWKTASEINNFGFYVERSALNEKNFVEIPESFIPGYGTTLVPHDYSYIDNTLGQWGTYYYRLRQVDNNGLAYYSQEVRLNTSALDAIEQAPVEFRVYQNYPNPFNPTTEIKFSVEKPEVAKVIVYNVIGQEVARLFDGLAEVGRYYRIKFDAANLESGVYFYRVLTSSQSEIKKMILLK